MDQDEIIFSILFTVILILGALLYIRIRKSSQRLREMISREKARLRDLRDKRTMGEEFPTNNAF